MFLLVENLLWKDLAGSVSPSLSEESPSPPVDEVGTGLVDTFVSLAAMRQSTVSSPSQSTERMWMNFQSGYSYRWQMTSNKLLPSRLM